MKSSTKASIITVIGNVASGKSTLLSLLESEMKIQGVAADNLFQVSDPFAKPFLSDMKRWSFTNELWLTAERAKLLRRELRKDAKGLVFFDSGLLMSWVYTYSHFLVGNITPDEWSFYLDLYDVLTNDILYEVKVIRLNYYVDTLMSRLQKRARDYELAFYTREYLGQLELGLNALEERLQEKRVKWLNIEENTVADFENNMQDTTKMLHLVNSFVS